MQPVDPRRENEAQAEQLVRARLRKIFDVFDSDPRITEVSINGNRPIFVTKSGAREELSGILLDEVTVASTIRELASAMGQDARPETPSAMTHAKLPGFRFAGALYPTSAFGSSISIRKHSPRVLGMADYVASGTFPQEVSDILSDLVREGANMIVAGGTDSGKTTFLNALSREIPVSERVGSIEDTRELSLVVPNWLPLEYNKQVGITPSMCVDFMMRSSPDRIILGELKDEVAAYFMEAANTGHHGCMATLHANNAQKALVRLETLSLRANLGWPLDAVRQTIATTMQVVVHLRKHGGKRELTEISRIKGFNTRSSEYELDPIFKVAV